MESSDFKCSAVIHPGGVSSSILKSFFIGTYSRGSFHYDIMVTLILAFIFITPHLWDFGAKPSQWLSPVISPGRSLMAVASS